MRGANVLILAMALMFVFSGIALADSIPEYKNPSLIQKEIGFTLPPSIFKYVGLSQSGSVLQLNQVADGAECNDYNEYDISNSYCSGNINMYYQCTRNLQGLAWKKVSVDCTASGYNCVQTTSGYQKCVPNSNTSQVMRDVKWYLLVFVAFSIALYFYWQSRKGKK